MMEAPDATREIATPVPDAPASRWRNRLILAGIVLVALFALGLVPRLHLDRQLAVDAQARRDSLPAVAPAHPERAPAVVDLSLPGSTEPYLTTGIFARTNGYLDSRYVDIGDRVTAGQLLAEISSPEVDQQLRQAQADVTQAKANVVQLEANLGLARSTLARYVAAGVGSVSKQQIDERTSAVTTNEKAVDAARATVNANQANVDRLLELQGFEQVYAPFDGVITMRSVDPGALISAGSTQGTTQLFSLAQVDRLRIFVFVPQSYAPDIHTGQTAQVTVRELPGRTFQGTVTRTAGAIDPSSRTMQTEVQVPNPDGALLSGSYVTVRFQIERASPPLLIPAGALLIDAQGVRVAVVGPDDVLHYRPIEIGRDFGDRVEVAAGLEVSELIATRLPGGLPDGAKVQHPDDEAAKSQANAPRGK